MHKTLLAVVLSLMFAASAAAQEDSWADVWKNAVGKRGTIQHQDGQSEYVFTLDDAGGMVIVHVGRDYVDFARFTREKGERRTHRLIPMARLVMRRSKLSP